MNETKTRWFLYAREQKSRQEEEETSSRQNNMTSLSHQEARLGGSGDRGGGGKGVDLRDLAADAQQLAMAMSSDTPDSQYLVGRLVADHAPALRSVRETLLSVTAKLGAVKTRKEELVALTKMCTFVAAASVIVVSQQRRLNGSGGGDSKKILRLLDLGPLEECVDDLELVVERLGRRRKPLPLLRRSSKVVKSDIVDLNSRVVDLAKEMGLAGVLAVFRGVLVRKKKKHVRVFMFPR